MDFFDDFDGEPPMLVDENGWNPGLGAFSSHPKKPQGCFLCHCWSGGESTRRGTAEGTGGTTDEISDRGNQHP